MAYDAVYDAHYFEADARGPAATNASVGAKKDESAAASAKPAPVHSLAASLLAYLAAAPLVAGALLLVASPDGYGPAARAFMGLYGAALIVFFGGVRWGVAVMKPEGPTMGALLGAALPLIAALPLFLPFDPTLKFPAIMALIMALLIDDSRATCRGSGAPAWYLGVRAPLTVLIEIAFLVALAAGLRT